MDESSQSDPSRNNTSPICKSIFSKTPDPNCTSMFEDSLGFSLFCKQNSSLVIQHNFPTLTTPLSVSQQQSVMDVMWKWWVSLNDSEREKFIEEEHKMNEKTLHGRRTGGMVKKCTANDSKTALLTPISSVSKYFTAAEVGQEVLTDNLGVERVDDNVFMEENQFVDLSNNRLKRQRQSSREFNIRELNLTCPPNLPTLSFNKIGGFKNRVENEKDDTNDGGVINLLSVGSSSKMTDSGFIAPSDVSSSSTPYDLSGMKKVSSTVNCGNSVHNPLSTKTTTATSSSINSSRPFKKRFFAASQLNSSPIHDSVTTPTSIPQVVGLHTTTCNPPSPPHDADPIESSFMISKTKNHDTKMEVGGGGLNSDIHTTSQHQEQQHVRPNCHINNNLSTSLFSSRQGNGGLMEDALVTGGGDTTTNDDENKACQALLQLSAPTASSTTTSVPAPTSITITTSLGIGDIQHDFRTVGQHRRTESSSGERGQGQQQGVNSLSSSPSLSPSLSPPSSQQSQFHSTTQNHSCSLTYSSSSSGNSSVNGSPRLQISPTPPPPTNIAVTNNQIPSFVQPARPPPPQHPPPISTNGGQIEPLELSKKAQQQKKRHKRQHCTDQGDEAVGGGSTVKEGGGTGENKQRYKSLRESVWEGLALNLLQQVDDRNRELSFMVDSDLPLNLSGQCSIRGQTIIEHIIESILDDPKSKNSSSSSTSSASSDSSIDLSQKSSIDGSNSHSYPTMNANNSSSSRHPSNHLLNNNNSSNMKITNQSHTQFSLDGGCVNDVSISKLLAVSPAPHSPKNKSYCSIMLPSVASELPSCRFAAVATTNEHQRQISSTAASSMMTTSTTSTVSSNRVGSFGGGGSSNGRNKQRNMKVVS